MSSRLITRQSDFERLCREIRAAGIVAFDTEFVSDDSYRPELGLLQFATAERLVAVDPLAPIDLAAWWAIMGDEETAVVVHAGQAEVRFCLTLAGLRPHKLADIQIAEGLRSRGYPLSYSALAGRVVGRSVHGAETRTEWTRRPLSPRQIEYALEDVQFILPVWEKQRASLEKLGRLAWAEAEFERMIEDIEADLARPAWTRLSGLHRLRPRELAVARELAEWREREAARRNCPVRRVLRDDVIIELARRRPGSFSELTALRDMKRRSYRRAADELLECVQRGLQAEEPDRHEAVDFAKAQQGADERIVGQILALALAGRCAELDVSRQLVGTAADLHELIAWHNAGRPQPPPRLAAGWRAEVCGSLLSDVLEGRVAVRVAAPGSEQPLEFVATEGE